MTIVSTGVAKVTVILPLPLASVGLGLPVVAALQELRAHAATDASQALVIAVLFRGKDRREHDHTCRFAVGRKCTRQLLGIARESVDGDEVETALVDPAVDVIGAPCSRAVHELDEELPVPLGAGQP